MIRILVAATGPALLGGQDGLVERFRAAFAERLDLEVVGGALYALTSLERRRADLIIISETLEDMSGRDLFDLVCDDAALRQLPFILLSGADDLVLPDHHLVLAAQASPTEILAEAFCLLLASGKLGETRKTETQAAEAQEVKAQEETRAKIQPRELYQGDVVKISGTLEALTLFDLVVSLGQGRRSGRLVVFVGATEGTLYLREGRLSHATFARATGEDALQQVFARVHHVPETKFLFVVGVTAKTPTTIRTSLDKLLLQVAVTLDETGELDNRNVPA